MKKKLFGIISLSIILIGACKKDLDFKKFDKFELKPEMGFPVAILDVRMSKILEKNDSTIFYDPDGLIRFAFRQDNIGSFNADSVFKSSVIPPVTNYAKLGEIDIADFEATSASDLDTIVSGFSATTQAGYQFVRGQTATFPAFNDANFIIRKFSAPSNFNNVTFSNGWLIMTFHNYLPVFINTINLNIYNQNPIATLLGTLSFSNIPPDGFKTDSINLTGKTMSNSLGYNIPVFNSNASSSPVYINPDDSIVINATSRDLKAIAGSAIFPSQSIDAQNMVVDVASSEGERIKNLEFKSFNINYSIQSSVEEQIQVKIDFPGATKNGNAFPSQIINVTNNTVTGTIDLSDVKINMGTDITQPYNRFKVSIQPSIISSNTVKNFDSSNAIVANFTFDNIKPKAVDGYLGSRTLNISEGNLDVEFFEKIESGLYFSDPKLKVKSVNSIGLPIKLNLNLKGTRNQNQQNLNTSAFTLPYPTLSQRGDSIEGLRIIDKSNSQLVDVIAIAPTKLEYSGNATINQDGFTGYTDFINEDSKISLGFEMDLPFSLNTSTISVIDTMDNFISEDILNEIDKIEYIDLIARVENGFPFEGSFNFVFTDDSYNIIDTLDAPLLFLSSIQDANGRVSQKTITVKSIRLSKDFLYKLKFQKAKLVLATIKINTYANGNVPVKIYSDYVTKIGLSIKTKAIIKLNK